MSWLDKFIKVFSIAKEKEEEKNENNTDRTTESDNNSGIQ